MSYCRCELFGIGHVESKVAAIINQLIPRPSTPGEKSLTQGSSVCPCPRRPACFNSWGQCASILRLFLEVPALGQGFHGRGPSSRRICGAARHSKRPGGKVHRGCLPHEDQGGFQSLAGRPPRASRDQADLRTGKYPDTPIGEDLSFPTGFDLGSTTESWDLHEAKR